MSMEANTLMERSDRPLVGRLESLDNGERYGRGQQNNEDASDSRLARLISDFFRGDKEKRRRWLKSDPLEALQNQAEMDEEADKYEPQRITRKIHWQYDRSMKKVPMLRRDYIK
jgi:hypothetical protein